jgi:hypothetical protein
MGGRSGRKMEKRLETKIMKLAKETLKRIIKEELQTVMNEMEGGDEYQEEYDLVMNNITTDSKPPNFILFALRSLEDSYGNRYYNHSKVNVGLYLKFIGQHILEGQDSRGGTIEQHIATVESRLEQHPDLLTPAGRARVDALLKHIKENYL